MLGVCFILSVSLMFFQEKFGFKVTGFHHLQAVESTGEKSD
jgi:hypothetical protein